MSRFDYANGKQIEESKRDEEREGKLKELHRIQRELQPIFEKIWLHGAEKHGDNEKYKGHSPKYYVSKSAGHLYQPEDSETKLPGIYHYALDGLIAARLYQIKQEEK